MKIHLPNSAFLGNIDPFLRSFNNADSSSLEITSNKQWISIHPAVLSMVAALGLKVKKIKCKNMEAKSKHYLERMGLFQILNLQMDINIKEHESAGRFIPITQIKNSQELTKFVTDMIPLLHLEPEQAEPIKYIISELVRNVIEHSESSDGAIVSAQYYKKSNCIKIGIVDTGVGIKKTINRSHKADSDLDAIRLALTPGITGTTRKEGGTEFNAGAGLFFIKSMAIVNKNFFMIYSGNAMYKLLKQKKLILNADPLRDRHSSGEDYPTWQGTIVGVDISLDSNKEFFMLLDLIRDTYVKSIKERKKEKYRRPRFI